jgi:hypothetical protein
MKNITSEVMKSNMPNFKPVFTWSLWDPPSLDSRSVSRHQEYERHTIRDVEIRNITTPKFWNHIIRDTIRLMDIKDAVTAQGLISTV